ncbi:hypothetical protein B5566_02665 [Mycobacterium sp. MHSD3]|nr:hypothetical protein B5566_02665 [Mycobacterium sp. MHSD3]
MSAREVAAKALREYFGGVGQSHHGSADAVLSALKANGYAVVPIPSVLHKGPHDTDSTMYAAAADRLDRNYGVGGSNLRRAVSQLLKYVSSAAAERDSGDR